MDIVITGASKGLGSAVAEAFAADGQAHRFFLCARGEQALQAFAAGLKKKHPGVAVYTFAADLAVETAATAFASFVLGRTRQIDVLVNNAGQFVPGSIWQETAGTLEQMIAVNLYSAYHLTRALLPVMMERKAGHIFNMCSIASLQAYPNGGSYSISKFALAGFSKNLREEMKAFNIKVTALYPGAAFTDSWRGSGIDPERIMEAGDVAAMVCAAAKLSPSACVEDIVLRPQLGDL